MQGKLSYGSAIRLSATLHGVFEPMRIRRVIQKRIDHQEDGVNIAGSISGAISANVNEGGSGTHVRTRSSNRIVQRGGKTEIFSDSDADDQSSRTQEVSE